ncbi:hypothetical protein K438DRAFT_1987273 [Mycena galopus ATCC 62051]|nr:hypothetical protein K438DRAFT_1987273 [Mycena galopus ATCC 62051]
MAFSDRVPTEVWAEILGNVFKYDRRTFQSFSLVCRDFLPVSRPFIFYYIRVAPFRNSGNGSLCLPSPSEVDLRLERLDFLCSPEIAPLVRFCQICADPRRDSDKWSFSTDTPYILLDALFQRLGQFTGLQKLHASRIYFTQVGLDNLCRLPNLFELQLFECSAVPGARIEPSPRALRISNFNIYYHDSHNQADDYWFSMLQPDQLRVLTSNFALGRTVHASPSFNNVRTLKAIMHDPTPAQHLTIMSKFPGVRILELRGKGLQPDAVAPAVAVFPLLEQYHGPYEALPFFLASTTLRRVRTECVRAEDLSTRIQGVQGHNITSLYVDIRGLNTTVFNKIVDLFPRLTQLLITTGVSDLYTMFTREIHDARKLPKNVVVDGRYGDEVRAGFKPSTFFLKLATTPFLPPALERLAICWDCYDRESYAELSAYEVPDFPQLRDALVVRCPGLNWLWFNGIYFMFEWRDPMPDGTVKEFIAKDFMGAYRRRESAAPKYLTLGMFFELFLDILLVIQRYGGLT